jgi:predicted flap endonuclease-1-like 5' DNA nuclease
LKQENAALKATATAPSAELEALKQENAALKATATAPNVELEALKKENATLKAQQTATTEPSDRQRDLERQLREQQREVFNLQADLAKLRTEKPADGEPRKELDWLKREKEDLEQDVRDLESRIDRLEKDNSDLRAQARDKSSAGPALDKLTKERDRLRAELDKLKKGNVEPVLVNVDFSHLGIATADQKNALSRINGIGPVVEGKLNQLGIFTFAQISRLSEADMERIDEVLQLFPGRVKRENWVEQAANLME